MEPFVKFDVCEDCGPGYLPLVLLVIYWAVPLSCVAVRRHLGPGATRSQQLKPLIWVTTALALWASWNYINAWWWH